MNGGCLMISRENVARRACRRAIGSDKRMIGEEGKRAKYIMHYRVMALKMWGSKVTEIVPVRQYLSHIEHCLGWKRNDAGGNCQSYQLGDDVVH